MKVFVFPGQGAQFAGMGKDLYLKSKIAKELFESANKVLDFDITDVMFGNDDEALKKTSITQPAIFLHSVITAKVIGEKFNPGSLAGHSLGEFSALVAGGFLKFEDGLILVQKRAQAMQKACEISPSTMAAIVGLENEVIEKVCKDINEIVVPANYNCPGQLVISGSFSGIELACDKLTQLGARRAIKLPVDGAFHSPIMKSAQEELEKAINQTEFKQGICPIYQNVNAQPTIHLEKIKENLIKQLTGPVMWTQTMQNMIKNGLTEVVEVGPGKVLQGLFKKVDRSISSSSAGLEI